MFDKKCKICKAEFDDIKVMKPRGKPKKKEPGNEDTPRKKFKSNSVQAAN